MPPQNRAVNAYPTLLLWLLTHTQRGQESSWDLVAMMSGSGLLDSGTSFILPSSLTECENPIKGQHDTEQWFPHLDDHLNYLGIFV